MTKKTDQGTDRRTLIAAATAAGVIATPVLASAAEPMRMAKGRPTVFKVDLGGVSLPEHEATELSNQISRLCLDAVARAGVKVANAGRVIGPHPGWYGFILRPQGVNAYVAE
ncbi:MAG TPA: hypothetical protein VG407_08995 [Caulobacteraceae bacterium]|jgi:hypothetical protein|nr:hypothetical protein [Caulobacteraceae bacterium]